MKQELKKIVMAMPVCTKQPNGEWKYNYEAAHENLIAGMAIALEKYRNEEGLDIDVLSTSIVEIPLEPNTPRTPTTRTKLHGVMQMVVRKRSKILSLS